MGSQLDGERPTRAVIDLDALRANAALAHRLAAGRDVIAVVKADGYGHGAVPVARALLEAGCQRLAVQSVSEAAVLREAAVAVPILVLGGVHDVREAERALALHATPVLHHAESLRQVADAARRGGAPTSVQLEVDTGMHRMGVPVDEAEAFMAAVEAEPGLVLEGVYTHLARADEPDPAPSLEQLGRFRALLRGRQGRGLLPPCIHAVNSAGLMAGKVLADALPEATAVRPGLMLYGVHPAPGSEVDLRPVMSVRTRVASLRRVPAGEAVGYGGSFRAERETRIATLPLGYADGVPWAAGNRGEVWLAGAHRRIVGRISMDFTAVDVGDSPVEVGDEAVLFGRGADGSLPVERAARAADTIPYELLVRVGARVRREFVG